MRSDCGSGRCPRLSATVTPRKTSTMKLTDDKLYTQSMAQFIAMINPSTSHLQEQSFTNMKSSQDKSFNTRNNHPSNSNSTKNSLGTQPALKKNMKLKTKMSQNQDGNIFKYHVLLSKPAPGCVKKKREEVYQAEVLTTDSSDSVRGINKLVIRRKRYTDNSSRDRKRSTEKSYNTYPRSTSKVQQSHYAKVSAIGQQCGDGVYTLNRTQLRVVSNRKSSIDSISYTLLGWNVKVKLHQSKRAERHLYGYKHQTKSDCISVYSTVKRGRSISRKYNSSYKSNIYSTAADHSNNKLPALKYTYKGHLGKLFPSSNDEQYLHKTKKKKHSKKSNKNDAIYLMSSEHQGSVLKMSFLNSPNVGCYVDIHGCDVNSTAILTDDNALSYNNEPLLSQINCFDNINNDDTSQQDILDTNVHGITDNVAEQQSEEVVIQEHDLLLYGDTTLVDRQSEMNAETLMSENLHSRETDTNYILNAYSENLIGIENISGTKISELSGSERTTDILVRSTEMPSHVTELSDLEEISSEQDDQCNEMPELCMEQLPSTVTLRECNETMPTLTQSIDKDDNDSMECDSEKKFPFDGCYQTYISPKRRTFSRSVEHDILHGTFSLNITIVNDINKLRNKSAINMASLSKSKITNTSNRPFIKRTRRNVFNFRNKHVRGALNNAIRYSSRRYKRRNPRKDLTCKVMKSRKPLMLTVNNNIFGEMKKDVMDMNVYECSSNGESNVKHSEGVIMSIVNNKGHNSENEISNISTMLTNEDVLGTVKLNSIEYDVDFQQSVFKDIANKNDTNLKTHDVGVSEITMYEIENNEKAPINYSFHTDASMLSPVFHGDNIFSKQCSVPVQHPKLTNIAEYLSSGIPLLSENNVEVKHRKTKVYEKDCISSNDISYNIGVSNVKRDAETDNKDKSVEHVNTSNRILSSRNVFNYLYDFHDNDKVSEYYFLDNDKSNVPLVNGLAQKRHRKITLHQTSSALNDFIPSLDHGITDYNGTQNHGSENVDNHSIYVENSDMVRRVSLSFDQFSETSDNEHVDAFLKRPRVSDECSVCYSSSLPDLDSDCNEELICEGKYTTNPINHNIDILDSEHSTIGAENDESDSSVVSGDDTLFRDGMKSSDIPNLDEAYDSTNFETEAKHTEDEMASMKKSSNDITNHVSAYDTNLTEKSVFENIDSFKTLNNCELDDNFKNSTESCIEESETTATVDASNDIQNHGSADNINLADKSAFENIDSFETSNICELDDNFKTSIESCIEELETTTTTRAAYVLRYGNVPKLVFNQNEHFSRENTNCTNKAHVIENEVTPVHIITLSEPSSPLLQDNYFPMTENQLSNCSENLENNESNSIACFDELHQHTIKEMSNNTLPTSSIEHTDTYCLRVPVCQEIPLEKMSYALPDTTNCNNEEVATLENELQFVNDANCIANSTKITEEHAEQSAPLDVHTATSEIVYETSCTNNNNLSTNEENIAIVDEKGIETISQNSVDFTNIACPHLEETTVIMTVGEHVELSSDNNEQVTIYDTSCHEVSDIYTVDNVDNTVEVMSVEITNEKNGGNSYQRHDRERNNNSPPPKFGTSTEIPTETFLSCNKPVIRNTAAQFDKKHSESFNMAYTVYRKDGIHNRTHVSDSDEIEEATNSIKEYEKVIEDDTIIKTVGLVKYLTVTTLEKSKTISYSDQVHFDESNIKESENIYVPDTCTHKNNAMDQCESAVNGLDDATYNNGPCEQADYKEDDKTRVCKTDNTIIHELSTTSDISLGDDLANTYLNGNVIDGQINKKNADPATEIQIIQEENPHSTASNYTEQDSTTNNESFTSENTVIMNYRSHEEGIHPSTFEKHVLVDVKQPNTTTNNSAFQTDAWNTMDQPNNSNDLQTIAANQLFSKDCVINVNYLLDKSRKNKIEGEYLFLYSKVVFLNNTANYLYNKEYK